MLKKIISIFKKTIAVILILLISLCALAQARKYIEKDDVKPLGTFVNVDGKKIHVYSQGEGNKTIVLMPGLGSIAPAIDFQPLISELKKDFKVVVVEPFGYGFSDETTKERSVENIVEETRTALKEANIQGPYILMPHSISGVYAEYYAAAYPKEVEALILLDTTLVKASLEEADKVDLSMAKKQLVLARLENLFGVDRIYYNSIYKDENCFSENDKKALVKMAVQKPFNKTMANEFAMILKNCETANKTKISKDLPILKFISIKSMKDINTEKYKTILDKNVNEFADYTKFTYCPLEGGHYIFYTKSGDIGKETREFLKKYDNLW